MINNNEQTQKLPVRCVPEKEQRQKVAEIVSNIANTLTTITQTAPYSDTSEANKQIIGFKSAH
jgi:hypothetical protein